MMLSNTRTAMGGAAHWTGHSTTNTTTIRDLRCYLYRSHVTPALPWLLH